MKRKLFIFCIAVALLLGAAIGSAWLKEQRALAVIGGADGPTAILISKIPNAD